MTDLEITRLCAEACGAKLDAGDEYYWLYGNIFDPLHDDAQAMALVKKFKLFVNHSDANESPYWKTAPQGQGVTTCNQDLNRAICECVSNMKKAGAI